MLGTALPHCLRFAPFGEEIMKRIWIPQVFTIAMLLWALNPHNPYGYYILLRWVCCAAFVYLAIQALAQDKEGWVWLFGVTAVVYNPIIRIHLTREIWSVVNVATIVVAVVSIFVLKVEHGKKELPNKTDAKETMCKEDIQIGFKPHYIVVVIRNAYYLLRSILKHRTFSESINSKILVRDKTEIENERIICPICTTIFRKTDGNFDPDGISICSTCYAKRNY